MASAVPAGLYDDSDEDDFMFGDEDYSAYNSENPPEPGMKAPKSKPNVSFGIGPGSKVNKPGSAKVEDLRMSIIRGNLQAATDLLDQGVDVNCELNEWSPLMLAGNLARGDIFKLLVDRGANVNYHKDLYTVLMATCGSNCQKVDVLDCIKLLVQKGADVNAHDRFHTTPLMYAAREGRLEVVEFLLDNGAQIDRQDTRGWTALSWATQREKLGVIKLLLQRGADKNKRHADNLTAIDLARGREEMVWMFENKLTSAADAGDAVVGRAGDGSAPTTPKNTSASVTEQYGDLEVFLMGLDLGNLRDLFQQHQVDFPLLLTMTEEDFSNMGISQVGVRKKLVEAVAAVHKRNWENSSLVPIRFKSQVKCPDAIAIVANLSKHLRYIASSVSYISDHLRHDSSFLAAGQDGSGPKQLLGHTHDGLQNATKLQVELSKLHSLLVKELSSSDFSPPDLIAPKVRRRRRVRQWPLTFVIVTSAAVLFWKRETILDAWHGVVVKVQDWLSLT